MAVQVNRSGSASGDVSSAGAVVATGVVVEAVDKLLVVEDNSEEGTPTNRTLVWRPDPADAGTDQVLAIRSNSGLGSLPRPSLRTLENPTPSVSGGGQIRMTHTNASTRKTGFVWATVKGGASPRTNVPSSTGLPTHTPTGALDTDLLICGTGGGISNEGASTTDGARIAGYSSGGTGGNGSKLIQDQGPTATWSSGSGNNQTTLAVPLGAVPDSGRRVTRFGVSRRGGGKRGPRWTPVER